MRCTNKLKKTKRLLCTVVIAALFMTGCKTEISNPYNAYSTDFISGYTGFDYFAKDICVTNNVNFGQDSVSSDYAQAAGAFNLDKKEVIYSHNIFNKMYPASTTKILTAYIILSSCNLSDTVTVSHEAANPGEKSSLCGIKEGDVVSVETLLYGLLLKSGNDAAVALAEHHSGSVDAFAEVMNETALKIGASKSHFTNPSGLPNEEHYTCVYDMYLIMSNALTFSKFNEIISTVECDVTYQDKNGNDVTKTYKNTCGYLTGSYKAPEGISVVGGKTGTTYDAGYCLVVLSNNQDGERIISIVFKADGKSDLYSYMNQILDKFGN